MPVELHPAEKADLPVFYDILWESGKSNVLASLMWPNGYPVVSRDWSVDRAAENMRERPEIMKYMKVIDTDLPADDPLRQILGIAQWEVHAHDRTDEEVKADAERSKALGLPPGANPAFLEEFHGSVGQAQARHLGNKAHVYLHLLFTHPDRFRQGAGSMHLQWGLELADKLGVPAYLESSPMGRALYERMGFEFVEYLPLDNEKWQTGDFRLACLLRPHGKAPNGNV